MTLTKLICCTLLIGYLPCLAWAIRASGKDKFPLWAYAFAGFVVDCMLLIPAIGVWLMFQ